MKGFIQLCLLASLGVAFACPFGDQHDGKRLIKTSEEQPGEWMTEEQIWALIEKHANFVDITGRQYPTIDPKKVDTKAIPTTTRYQTQVRQLLTTLSIPRMEDFVRHFSSFFNRHYQSATGVESQQWLFSQVQDSIRNYTAANASAHEVTHTWAQKSVVARIQGTDPSLRSEVVVLGAHQDSINTRGATLGAPGADDNASGSVVVLETLRVLVNSGFAPKRTIEFHWYAAEEVGLRGSGDIAETYYNSGVNVVAMVNLDVPGYHAPGIDEVGIYTDNVNPTLTEFLRVLVDEYLVFGRRNVVCGYGCSDHASFNKFGFPAAFPAEVVFHPQMHSLNDNFASVGFTQVNEFAKLAVGFMVEMAEPSN